MDETCVNDLSTEQAKGMIDQLAVVGAEQEFMPILVFSGGEPLCRDDIFELISYADSKGLICALASNGTLIDAEVARKIKASGVRRVSISLDGATADVHNKLRQQEGSFEGAIAGIECLKAEGIEFQINVTITKFNAHQVDDVFALAMELGAAAVHPFMLVPVGCGEEFAEEDMLSASEYEEMMVQIADKASKIDIQVKVTCGPHYERVVREHEKLKVDSAACGHPGGHPGGGSGASKGCLAGLGVLFVGHQGQVFPCGYLPVDCGDITKQTISDIWNNSVDLAKMRDVSELKGKCGVCGFKGVCGGCRARAYAASGDYMDQEPFCEYVPPKLK